MGLLHYIHKLLILEDTSIICERPQNMWVLGDRIDRQLGEDTSDRYLHVKFNDSVTNLRRAQIMAQIESWPEIDGVDEQDGFEGAVRPYLDRKLCGRWHLMILAKKLWKEFPSEIDTVHAAILPLWGSPLRPTLPPN